MHHNRDVDLALVERPSSGYVYTTGWRLATTDIDEHQQLRLDGVARYIQEVGAEHLADAQLAEVHPHWIVLRTVIDVINPIELPSDITFHRWCAALSTRWCSMRVQLQGSAGGRIETEGFWICVNKDTLTPSRLTDDCIARFGSTTENHRLKWRPWLTGPNIDGTETPFPLRRTDIDPFEHVNNTIGWSRLHHQHFVDRGAGRHGCLSWLYRHQVRRAGADQVHRSRVGAQRNSSQLDSPWVGQDADD